MTPSSRGPDPRSVPGASLPPRPTGASSAGGSNGALPHAAERTSGRTAGGQPVPIHDLPSGLARRVGLVVSNRLPVRRVRRRGKEAWEVSPGGLVSALLPVLQKASRGTWIGWPGLDDVDVEPFEKDGVHNVPLRLSRSERKAFYEEYSNRTLWPLYHDAVRPPRYSSEAWEPYARVNRRFAEEAARHAAPGDMVWVHDYHLQLVPAMLRELRPDVRIGFFLHIPFPPPELFGRLPQRAEILRGLLGADLVGFQTPEAAENFAHGVGRFVPEARIEADAVVLDGRRVRYRAFPISIDASRFADLAATEDARKRARRFRVRTGRHRKIFLGVDRLDYTKGIDVRLRAFQELLRSGLATPEECAFVQITVPSRERVREYVQEKDRIQRLVGEIDGEFSTIEQRVVYYMHRNHSPEQLAALYAAADVMVVTPLCDGMNLVSKEYVSARSDDTGVLVLSEFAGAAHELEDALLVNPYDIPGVVRALRAALDMPAGEQQGRMARLRRTVVEHDVHRWAEDFLGALAEG